MEVPQELRDLDQWVCWRFHEDRKVPVNPKTGANAKSNDEATWSSFEIAEQALAEHESWEGLGFMFKQDGGLFGIDLDGCRDPRSGQIADWAGEILDNFNSYAEISPSGTGVKIYARGKLPSSTGKKIALAETQITNKKPAIEAYDFGRYFAFTGDRFNSYSVTDQQANLNELCNKLWPVARVSQPSSQQQFDNRAKLAWEYISKIEPAISGQAGHNATFRVACKLVLGFDLRPEEAFPIIQHWNQNCVPPWKDSDLWKKLSDANTREGTRGFLLTNNQYSGPDVDLRALLAPQPLDQPKTKHEFPVECLKAEGLLGEIVKYNLATAYYPQPELALAGAIALLATITGRRVSGFRDMRTNMYLLGLAPSGGGKEYARSVNKKILAAAVGLDLLGPERIGSHAGLIGCMDRNPVQLFQLDEIGRLLETMQDAKKAPHLFNIGGVLMQLYSSADCVWTGDALADAKKIKTIIQPHCVVFGTSVPEKFWGSLSADNVTEGLVGRFMIFESKSGYTLPQVGTLQDGPPEFLINKVRDWISPPKEWLGTGNLAGAVPIVKHLECSQEAADRNYEHSLVIAQKRINERGMRPAIWSRANEKAQKLAIIHACSRADLNTARIELQDIEWGIRLANYITRELLRHAEGSITRTDHERAVKQIVKLIGEAGQEGLSRNTLTRKTQFLRSKYRDEIVSQLIESGHITQEQLTGTGRPLTVYRTSIDGSI